MRLDRNGDLDVNGTKSVDDSQIRFADSIDSKQFEKQFARLESKFREMSEVSVQYDPTTGTVRVHDKYSVTDHRSVVDDSAGSIEQPSERPSLRSSFAEAQRISHDAIGAKTKTYAAQADSGIYRGEIIGETALHVVQRLNGDSAVAHMKHMLSPIPNVGENVLIKYGKDFARVTEMRERSRGKELVR